MPRSAAIDAPPSTLERKDLDRLIGLLRERGYQVLGPVARGGAILWDEIESANDLPAGWVDAQDAGQYRLQRTDSPALFDFTAGPGSPKATFHPAQVELFRAKREGKLLQIRDGASASAPARVAFLGVRACDLAAVAIQDRVLLGGTVQDPVYRARREGALFVAVQCGRAGRTCFCASMGTGPAVRSGHDLVLTESVTDGAHVLVAAAGSARGTELLAALGARAATPAEARVPVAAAERAGAGMGRKLDTEWLPGHLAQNLEHPQWDDVEKRCLACANCTMVCPTCFCVNTEDFTDLVAGDTRRVRRWDSCYSIDFTYIHGGNVRSSRRARYRQWLTHKLGSWWEQFGTSGCVGCGRCITWCPAGIDITEEARALRQRRRGKEAARANA
jgi:sulfhydrogenase subunit beta (sulfur reductase)